jgi:type VI protein secretion system component VasF
MEDSAENRSAMEPGQTPQQEIALERRKHQAARVFVVAVLLMLVIAAVVVYILLQYRPS